MNTYEELLDEAEKNNISIHENYDLSGTKFQGLYCDGHIALSRELKTSAERNSILLEELGHHETSTGNILDLSVTQNRKQEYHARLWAYNKQIGLNGLIQAYKHGCKNSHEIAEYLEVTETFLLDAIECYSNKYGLYTIIDNYAIYFQPLAVLSF